MAMWAKPVGTSESFNADLKELQLTYPELPSLVEDFKQALAENPGLPRIPFAEDGAPEDEPELYAQMMDYPPLGGAGMRKFRISYWAPPGDPNPWQRFT